MDTSAPPCREVDLHQLELRYAQARLSDPGAVAQLVESIEHSGQLVPCIAASEAGRTGLVLVDGYRRVAALQRLRRDTVQLECWRCDLAQALLGVLARSRTRPFAALEEALLLRELAAGGLSQHEIARQSGRDVSWVCRRLQLLIGLPDSVLDAVRAGRVSTWAANRILAPLARANPQHADQLLAALRTTALSTRELRCWFEHYQQASQLRRERLVEQPRLLVDALAAQQAHQAGARLRDGPEGEALADMRLLQAVSTRLRKRLMALATPVLPESVESALAPLKHTLDTLTLELTRYREHDPARDSLSRADAAGARPVAARDQSPAQALA
jgi:ParB family chromosome partitioning protein